jgi:alpha(1,3/1,4) fucosyltransferase
MTSAAAMPATPSRARVALYIDPPTHHFLQDRLFDDDPKRLNGDRQNAPFAHIRNTFAAAGIPVRTADYLPDAAGDATNVYVSLGGLERFERLRARPDVVLSGFFALECPIVEPSLYRALPRVARAFRRVFSWSDSASLQRFTGSALTLTPCRWPQSFDDVHEAIWAGTDRKFLTMINANKLPRIYWQELYTERMRAVEFFSRTGEIDLYGKGWDGPSMRVGKTWVPWTVKRPWLDLQRRWQQMRPPPLLVAARSVYKGAAASKADVLGSYTFALCFENCILKGWITEKIFDCLFAGTVPVYWGAPEIAEVVPADCFIDMRQFTGYDDLRKFLRSLSGEAIARYRRCGREFLQSASYRPFSMEAFTGHFVEMLRADVPSAHLPAAGALPLR